MDRQHLFLDAGLSENAVEQLDLSAFGRLSLPRAVDPYLAHVVRLTQRGEEALHLAAGHSSRTQRMEAEGRAEEGVGPEARVLLLEVRGRLGDGYDHDPVLSGFTENRLRVGVLVQVAMRVDEELAAHSTDRDHRAHLARSLSFDPRPKLVEAAAVDFAEGVGLVPGHGPVAEDGEGTRTGPETGEDREGVGGPTAIRIEEAFFPERIEGVVVWVVKAYLVHAGPPDYARETRTTVAPGHLDPSECLGMGAGEGGRRKAAQNRRVDARKNLALRRMDEGVLDRIVDAESLQGGEQAIEEPGMGGPGAARSGP